MTLDFVYIRKGVTIFFFTLVRLYRIDNGGFIYINWNLVSRLSLFCLRSTSDGRTSTSEGDERHRWTSFDRTVFSLDYGPVTDGMFVVTF